MSQDMTGLRTRDQTLADLVAPFVAVHDVIAGQPQFMAWPSMRQFAVRGLRRLLARGSLARYATVYSRSMWPHSHVLAALIAVTHPQIEWRAEFSDPILRHVDGSMRRSQPLPTDDYLLRHLRRSLPSGYQEFLSAGGDQTLHLVQALPFALADRLVFTNSQQRTVMLADLGREVLSERALSRSEISPHPTPPGHWVRPPTGSSDRRLCRIGYFGTLYPNRGLGSLTEAIRLLPSEVRSRLRIDVYTGQRQASYEQVMRCGVGDVIRLRPELPYAEFLSAAGGYDHLLVTDTSPGAFPVANPFLPSKVSDYSATGANILAITSPGSELSTRGYAPSATVGDVISIRDALAEAVRCA
ncbi:glycosyltransferase family 4 protein [Ornithinimicrobium cavernae]|uniref:glycosyltransferase family 4 protein n=1 Tax=Ornithinimicrobium cavernae TaxID=2666047 RepID=UPI00137A510C|nr:glycosyltransferase family 4 protein [Ornithinimicrobium cavernae]